MAILDNSGDIILDAVLTEVGRKRLAQGKFKPTKFAFGDDEINYELYNKTHPSGSGYEDLEILQTPIMEAYTETNIIHGLRSLPPNILYMPDLILNEKLTGQTVVMKNSVINIAVNNETWKAIKDNWGSTYAMKAGATVGSEVLLFESGINDSNILPVPANQNSYITSLNMLDSSVTVEFDNSYINYIYGAPATWFPRVDSAGSWNAGAPILTSYTTVYPSDTTGRSIVNIPMSKAQVFDSSTSLIAVSTHVNMLGVVGSMGALNVALNPTLTTNMTQTAAPEWARYGSTNQTVTGLDSSHRFGIIHTTLSLTTNASGDTLTVPVALYRRES